MRKLMGFRGLVEIAFFCALAFFILISQWYHNPLKPGTQSTTSDSVFPTQKAGDVSTEGVDGYTLNETMMEIIEQERIKVREEMKDYEYPKGKYNISAERIEDLLIEEGGKPVRSIIVSTWRSGSTFLGGIFDAHPGNFYHFEPLLDYDRVQIRGPPLDSRALFRLKALLNCDYAWIGMHMELGNVLRLWYMKRCDTQGISCQNHEFFNAMCRVHPFQTMKLVRLRLNVAQKLLADVDLAVRMVLLVRDPRGTVNSRKQHHFCKDNRDCSDTALICADLIADYKDAVELRKKYPNTFRAIRYEDLAAAPYERAEELANFLGIGFHPKMINYLDTYTKKNGGIFGPYDTSRVTKQTPYHWKTELGFEEVNEIQRSCAAAMESWGYLPAFNSTHLKEFNPVTSYTLD